jgi:hypothetical protein
MTTQEFIFSTPLYQKVEEADAILIVRELSICTLSKDIHDFIDEAKAHQSIQHFEETYHNQNDQYSAQPMLNNGNEDK